jgi:hypothetical protein
LSVPVSKVVCSIEHSDLREKKIFVTLSFCGLHGDSVVLSQVLLGYCGEDLGGNSRHLRI